MPPVLAAVAAPSPRPKTILVVDGYIPFARALGRSLAAAGYLAAVVSSSLEAERILRSERPDLLLIDIEPHDPDSIALACQVAAEGRVPVVVMSSHFEADVSALFESANMIGIPLLEKPFGRSALLSRLAVLL